MSLLNADPVDGARGAPRGGLTVALLAPDGAGKSTLAQCLAETLPWPCTVEYLGLEGGRFAGRRRGIPGTGVMARVAYAWQTHLRTAAVRRSGGVVIYDRHPCEFLEGSRPDRLARLRRSVLSRALPRPDLPLVLDAPARVLQARRPEHGLRELAAARRRYLNLASRLDNALVVDADRPLDEVLRTAIQHIATARRRQRPIEGRWEPAA